jgi:hypothetical protein
MIPSIIYGLEKSDKITGKSYKILGFIYFTLTKSRRISWTMVVARKSVRSETQNVK